MPSYEIFKFVIQMTMLSNAAPHVPTQFDEYKAFLDTTYEEAEEPCEYAQDSQNELLIHWYDRNCK